MAQDRPVLERARTFAAEPVASRHARYFVVEWLEAHGRAEFTDRVGLAVSELAANAVLHTTKPFTVGLDWRDDCLRLELVDSAPTRMAVPVPTTGSAVDITSISETGRGLQIVGALANRWGVTVDPNIKMIWAEFLADPPLEPSEPALLDRRPPAPPAANVTRLRYLGLPVRTAIESGLDVEDATRDIVWIAPEDRTEEDKALLALVDDSSSVRLAGRHAAMHASGEDKLEFDLELDATDDALRALGALTIALAERRSQRRKGPSNEVLAFRAWLLAETERQRAGATPRRFGDVSPIAPAEPHGVVTVDSAGDVVVHANEALLRHAGWSGVEGENGLTRVVFSPPSQHADELLHALQQTLIPAEPPAVPGLDVAAAYHPAQGEVGGDFYDVFEVAADDWCVVLGDVSGKGVDAAIVTSAARHAVRSAALREPIPSGLMTALNRALVAQDSSRFCTVVLARLQMSGDSWVATFTTGGHPFPLLARHGTVTKMGRPGSLLGVFDDVSFYDVSIRLAVGDALVLFTDGIIEARNASGELFGDERLHEAIIAAPPSAQGIVDTVLDRVLSYQAGRSSDDIAVVVIRRSEL